MKTYTTAGELRITDRVSHGTGTIGVADIGIREDIVRVTFHDEGDTWEYFFKITDVIEIERAEPGNRHIHPAEASWGPEAGEERAIWVVTWNYLEENENGAWVCASFEAAVRTVQENEDHGMLVGDGSGEFQFDIVWSARRHDVIAYSEGSQMEYRIEKQEVHA